jgi:YVTN family beta-propeller protein
MDALTTAFVGGRRMKMFAICFPAVSRSLVVLFLMLSTAMAVSAQTGSFVAFESGQVRPMTMSPDGTRLFVVNTPDNRLEIFAVGPAGLNQVASVPVGLEPIAVAARNNTEVWVVNHLSDSVSVVSLDPVARVTRTLKVGDEPRDIVFAGPGGNRAFIAAANREVTRSSPGGAADIWVFDADNLGSALLGTPLTIVNLFSDVPRGLAASPDGSSVYAAALHSGNQTTVVSGAVVQDNGLPPFENIDGVPAPRQGLIVKWDGAAWRDAAGRDWSAEVPISMPDYDLFTIDANADTPAETASLSGVGTTLFNVAVNPDSGVIYVSNTEAFNNIRFEGPGIYGGSTVRGHMVDNRITVIDGGTVTPRDLNTHIDYSLDVGTQEENDKSLAMPLEMVISADGNTLYVAAFSSSKVGIFSTAELENGTFVPDDADHIEVNGGGPSGLVLDEANDKLYVFKRFNNSVGIIDLNTNTETTEIALYNPEPPEVVNGRQFLYDARFSSSRGNGSCASCHIFGDMDHLSWELGNPDGSVENNPDHPLRLDLFPALTEKDFHPMKGPMNTQSLRGMANHGPMHWRGDRSGGNEPEADPFDEIASFKTFRVAFEGLIGRAAIIPEPDMEAFADFALSLTYPPNPLRRLDNQPTQAQAIGEFVYRNTLVETFFNGQQFTCNDCHVVDVTQGFFGSDGFSTSRPGRFGGGDVVKIPHLRNVYTKLSNNELAADPNGASGDQYRGFFINHEGSTSTLFNFLTTGNFDFPGGDNQRLNVLEFVLAMPSNMAPAVGRQVTADAANRLVANVLVQQLEARALVTVPVPECDLVAKAWKNGEPRSWLFQSDGRYQSDRAAEPTIGRVGLILSTTGAATGQLTFTCVPPGSGERIALDRDEDGVYDRDELDAGTSPSDPTDFPVVPVTLTSN